jgi:hypothetical protein
LPAPRVACDRARPNPSRPERARTAQQRAENAAEVFRVRRLLLPAAAVGLIAVPAVSMAAPEPKAITGNDQLVGIGPLKRAAVQHEARSKLKLATTRAKRKATPPPPKVTVSPHLQAIAQCESGGDPHAIGGGGTYRGKYQFSYATWAAVGGSGDPAAAPEAEQDKRAAMLYERSGPGQWPVCGS